MKHDQYTSDGVIKESSSEQWKDVKKFLHFCNHIASLVNKESSVKFTYCGISMDECWVEPYIDTINGQVAKEIYDLLIKENINSYIDCYGEEQDEDEFGETHQELKKWSVTLPGIRLEKEIDLG